MNPINDSLRGSLPPLSSPSSVKSVFENFTTYVYELFQASLSEDKSRSQALLKDPCFGNRIIKNLPAGSLRTPRIVILNLLAHKALGKFQKQEISELIYAVGKSSYVASCSNGDIEALYTGLFSWPHSRSFSQTELLDFEHLTIEPLQPDIFKKLSDHPSFEGRSIVTINDIARRHLKYLPKPHIQYLAYTISNDDSDIKTKINSLKWSVFSYEESKGFSKQDLMVLEKNASQALRPYILKWALEHPAFSRASLRELEYFTEKLEETSCSREVRIEFLSSLLKHPSLPLLAINR